MSESTKRTSLCLMIYVPQKKGRTNPQNSKATSVKNLCVEAGIRCKASGPKAELDVIFIGKEHETCKFMFDNGLGGCYINNDDIDGDTDEDRALCVLEILAYGFHQYAARESVRGIFSNIS